MATVQTIITRALRRTGLVGIGQTAPANYSIEALEVFNDMLYGWELRGIDLKLSETRTAEFTLTDTFRLFVAPPNAWKNTLDNFTYKGTWNASTNDQSLSNGSGSDGDCWLISTSGTTSLDGVTDWTADNYALAGNFDTGSNTQTGLTWRQSVPTRVFYDGIAAALAVRLSEEFGYEIHPFTVDRAKDAMDALYSHNAPSPVFNNFDPGIVYVGKYMRVDPSELT